MVINNLTQTNYLSGGGLVKKNESGIDILEKTKQRFKNKKVEIIK